jgi:hypothetical protein
MGVLAAEFKWFTPGKATGRFSCAGVIEPQQVGSLRFCAIVSVVMVILPFTVVLTGPHSRRHLHLHHH